MHDSERWYTIARMVLPGSHSSGSTDHVWGRKNAAPIRPLVTLVRDAESMRASSINRRSAMIASGQPTNRPTSRIQSRARESLQAALVACSTTLIYHNWKFLLFGKGDISISPCVGGALFLRDLAAPWSDESESEDEDPLRLLERYLCFFPVWLLFCLSIDNKRSPPPSSFGRAEFSDVGGVIVLATWLTKPGGVEGNTPAGICGWRSSTGCGPADPVGGAGLANSDDEYG